VRNRSAAAHCVSLRCALLEARLEAPGSASSHQIGMVVLRGLVRVAHKPAQPMAVHYASGALVLGLAP
jgi:hypothetical protein